MSFKCATIKAKSHKGDPSIVACILSENTKGIGGKVRCMPLDAKRKLKKMP